MGIVWFWHTFIFHLKLTMYADDYQKDQPHCVGRVYHFLQSSYKALFSHKEGTDSK
jgi:hypothetical protein